MQTASRKGRLSFIIILLIVMNDIADAVSQTLMKAGLTNTFSGAMTPAAFVDFILRNATSWVLWAGIAIYILGFFFWIIVLSRIDLSIALPVGSLCYILTPLCAVIFLREHVSVMRWAGVGLIIAGVWCVSRSAARSGEASPHHG